MFFVIIDTIFCCLTYTQSIHMKHLSSLLLLLVYVITLQGQIKIIDSYFDYRNLAFDITLVNQSDSINMLESIEGELHYSSCSGCLNIIDVYGYPKIQAQVMVTIGDMKWDSLNYNDGLFYSQVYFYRKELEKPLILPSHQTVRFTVSYDLLERNAPTYNWSVKPILRLKSGQLLVIPTGDISKSDINLNKQRKIPSDSEILNSLQDTSFQKISWGLKWHRYSTIKNKVLIAPFRRILSLDNKALRNPVFIWIGEKKMIEFQEKARQAVLKESDPSDVWYSASALTKIDSLGIETIQTRIGNETNKEVILNCARAILKSEQKGSAIPLAKALFEREIEGWDRMDVLNIGETILHLTGSSPPSDIQTYYNSPQDLTDIQKMGAAFFVSNYRDTLGVWLFRDIMNQEENEFLLWSFFYDLYDAYDPSIDKEFKAFLGDVKELFPPFTNSKDYRIRRIALNLTCITSPDDKHLLLKLLELALDDEDQWVKADAGEWISKFQFYSLGPKLKKVYESTSEFFGSKRTLCKSLLAMGFEVDCEN